MKCAWIAAAVASVIGASACYAQEAVDTAKAATLDIKMFTGPLSHKTNACFVRRYDANHLAKHASNDLVAGADDRIFLVDHADLHECSELVTDRKELAALRHK